MLPSRRALLLPVLCLLALGATAQDAPPPPAPFPPPITGYLGRYLDSSDTPSLQSPPRTFRTTVVKAAPDFDRLYMIIGSTFVGQTLSTFPERVATEPLLTSTHGERHLAFEQWVDAERSPGWTTPAVDSQDRLYDFDWDDRGNIYLAYSVFGLGVIDQNFQRLAQVFGPVAPQRVIAFRNGSSYYVMVSNGTGPGFIYNVTNPASPVLAGGFSGGYRQAARTTDGHIAVITGSSAIEIHTPPTLLANAIGQVIPGTFVDVTTDGTNFYAIDITGDDFIHILQPNGATFTDTIVPALPGRLHTDITYGAGYLTVVGSNRPAIYRVDGTTLTLLSDGTYFFDYVNSVTPTNPFVVPRMYLPVQVEGETLLVAAEFGIGDAFTMADAHAPLTVAKAFAPATIQPYGTSQLTVTVTNPTPVPVTFSLFDPYGFAITNADGPSSTTCGAGILTAPLGTEYFDLQNGTVAANGSCTISIAVTSRVSGTWPNTILPFAIASADNTNDLPASASLTVGRMAAPQIQKAFSRTEARLNTPFRLTITITNPNTAGPIEGLAFTDTYPAGLVNATPVNAANTCNGTLVAAAGGSSLSYSGSIGPLQSCTIAVDVIATQAGSLVNTIPAGSATSANADPGGAAAPATVTAAASFDTIPTLSEWALILLASLLGLVAMLRARAS